MDSDVRKELDGLLDFGLPFAFEMLGNYGEFFPFASAVETSGEVVAVSVHQETEDPPAVRVIEDLRRVFRSSAENGEYRATALFYSVSVENPDTGVVSDSVAVDLDHVAGESLVVFFPYEVSGAELTVGEAFAQSGAGAVFGRSE